MEALEFFSGIGGFAVAAQRHGQGVVCAIDQDVEACATYRSNINADPIRRTLDSGDLSLLPEADLWWMSPPCTPFSRRGLRKDASDPRTVGFVRLIDEAAARAVAGRGPTWILVENVAAFAGSQVHRHLEESWRSAGYGIAARILCPTQFGIPMKRPRLFLAAGRGMRPVIADPPPPARRPLSSFLDPEAEDDEALRVPQEQVARYGTSLNILDGQNPEAVAICFTSGYAKSWKAAGSFLRRPDGGLRRFSPREILALLGFPPSFAFPETIPLARQYHLAGNSLSVPCVEWVSRIVREQSGGMEEAKQSATTSTIRNGIPPPS